MGYDSDHPLSEGEVGKCGVAISSLADMEVLFDKIPLANVTTSMTINSPAAVIWAMYLAVAEKQGADWKKISGTLQNDILKEYIAQKEYIYPPEPSMRLVIDTFEFAVKNTPKFNPISISGYHIREAGSTAIQELAFTLRDGMEYVEYGMRRGLDVDQFVPQLSFFFNAHNDFFEEIAKYRAARRIWHKAMVERYGAKNPAHLGAALPHANRGLLAHRAATLQQRRAHRDPGAGRRPRRNAISAHQFPRRSLGSADRIRRHHRAPHATNHRARNRRHQHGRSARRLVFCRNADQRSRARRVGLHRKNRRHGRHGSRHRTQLPATRNRGSLLPLPGEPSTKKKKSSSASTITSPKKSRSTLCKSTKPSPTAKPSASRNSAPTAPKPKSTAA